jgi:hypothetical protein
MKEKNTLSCQVMKDYLKKYAQQQFISQLSIIGVSFALAIGIYFFIWDSQVGKFIKTNVREAGSIESTNGDLSLEKDSSNVNQVLVKSNKAFNQVKAISITFTYNSENITIKSMDSLLDGGSLQNISNEPGIATIFLQYDTPRNIHTWDYLALLKTAHTKDSLEYINMMNANFRDATWENYLLSTSWINF